MESTAPPTFPIEVEAHALVSLAKNVPLPYLGAPVRMVLSSLGAQPLWPFHSTPTISGRALFGLFTRFHLGGSKAWAVFSITQPPYSHEAGPEGEHSAMVWRFEDPKDREISRIQWVGACAFSSLRDEHGFMRMLYFDVTKGLMGRLQSIYGPPEGDGGWVFTSLLPRRNPAALRVISPESLQVWVSL